MTQKREEEHKLAEHNLRLSLQNLPVLDTLREICAELNVHWERG